MTRLVVYSDEAGVDECAEGNAGGVVHQDAREVGERREVVVLHRQVADPRAPVTPIGARVCTCSQ